MSEIVGLGAAVMDTLITLPSYPKENSKAYATAVKPSGGGPAATGLAAAAKLGAACAFIGCLAEDAGGRFLRDDFVRYGVDVDCVDSMPGRRSFTSVILLCRESASRTCLLDRGDLPPLRLSVRQKQAVRDARVLMVDGNELDAAVEAARIARQSGTKVLYDAGGLYPGVERLLRLTDILIPSEEFALEYTGESDVYRAAEKLYGTYRPAAVVVTRGRLGGVLLADGKFTDYPIYPAEVVDSNGAGDVFHGAFAFGLVKGYSPEQCCHFSSAVSALKCTGVGARESVPDFDTVIRYLRRNGYEL